jgi:hypothetical protein
MFFLTKREMPDRPDAVLCRGSGDQLSEELSLSSAKILSPCGKLHIQKTCGRQDSHF